MNDRFLDDTNIKKSVQAINPQLQAALARTKQLKEGISQQINVLFSEDKQKLMQPVQIDKKQIVDNIQESLDLPKPVTKSKRNRKVAQKIEEQNKTNILDSYNDDDQISRNLAVDNIDNLAVNQLITDTVRQSSLQLSQSAIVKDNDKEPDIIPLDRPDRIIRVVRDVTNPFDARISAEACMIKFLSPRLVRKLLKRIRPRKAALNNS